MTPQAKLNRARRAAGRQVSVVLTEPDAIATWDAIRSRLGGQKPAVLWLLRNAPDKQP